MPALWSRHISRAAIFLMLVNCTTVAMAQSFSVLYTFPPQVGGRPGAATNLLVGNDGNLYLTRDKLPFGVLGLAGDSHGCWSAIN